MYTKIIDVDGASTILVFIRNLSFDHRQSNQL